MYEDLVATARRIGESAVRESQARVDLAVSKSEEANRKAVEASKSFGERWTNRINAMRRRAADRAKPTEMKFDYEDGPHSADHNEHDELVALTAPGTTHATGHTPPFNSPQQTPEAYGRHTRYPESDPPARFVQDEQPQPPFTPPSTTRPRRSLPRDDDEEDYSGRSWLE